MGSKRFGLRCLKALVATKGHGITRVVTIDDRSDSRSCLEDFQQFCNSSKLPLLVATSPKMANEFLIRQSFELGFVNGWYWIFPSDVIRSFSKGLIGIHNSLLPQYRGGAPLVWQIINREKIVGSSLFYLTEGMDEGDLLHQVRVPLKGRESINEVLNSLEDKMLSALPHLWKRLRTGKLKGKKQDRKKATYCAQRIPNDGQIDWNKNAIEIDAFIRAQSSPYPGAYFLFEDRKYIVEKSSVFSRPYFGSPGQVLKIENQRALIACGGASALWIEELRTDNHPVEKIRDVLKSIQTRL